MRVVAASPVTVFNFLERLENHWALAGRWVEPLSIDDSAGEICIHGPLGLRRTARTTVIDATPNSVLHGTAELSGGTSANVAWELDEDPNGTRVRLSAEVVRAAPLDRVLLALGGARWMRGRFAAILARLDEQVR